MVGVVGKAIKGFGKALKNKSSIQLGKKVINRTTGKPFPETTQRHMREIDKRKTSMKKLGYKGPTYRPSGKKSKTGAHLLEEVWTRNPYKKAKPSKLKKILKDQRTKGLATGAVIGGAYKLGEEKGKGKK